MHSFLSKSYTFSFKEITNHHYDNNFYIIYFNTINRSTENICQFRLDMDVFVISDADNCMLDILILPLNYLYKQFKKK